MAYDLEKNKLSVDDYLNFSSGQDNMIGAPSYGAWETSRQPDPQPEEQPGFFGLIRSGFERHTILGDVVARHSSQSDLEDQGIDQELDPFSDPRVLELGPDHYHRFTDVFDQQDLESELNYIKRQTQNQLELRNAGWQGVAAEAIGAMSDPLLLIPFGGNVIRAGQVVKSAARAARAAAVQEAANETILQARQQELRSTMESILNVGGAMIVGSAIGAVGGRLTKGQQQAGDLDDTVRNALIDDIEPRVLYDTEQEKWVPNETWREFGIDIDDAGLSRHYTTGKGISLGLGSKQLSSPFASLRRNALKLMNLDNITKQHWDGRGVGQSVEARINAQYGRMTRESYENTEKQWKQYKNRTAGQPDSLSREQFNIEVSRAAENGDRSEIPEVQNVAKFDRERIKIPLAEQAKAVGLFDDGLDVTSASNYLNRIWDAEKIKANPQRFINELEEMFRRNTTRAFDQGEDIKTALIDMLDTAAEVDADGVAKVDVLEQANGFLDELNQRFRQTRARPAQEASDQPVSETAEEVVDDLGPAPSSDDPEALMKYLQERKKRAAEKKATEAEAQKQATVEEPGDVPGSISSEELHLDRSFSGSSKTRSRSKTERSLRKNIREYLKEIGYKADDSNTLDEIVSEVMEAYDSRLVDVENIGEMFRRGDVDNAVGSRIQEGRLEPIEPTQRQIRQVEQAAEEVEARDYENLKWRDLTTEEQNYILENYPFREAAFNTYKKITGSGDTLQPPLMFGSRSKITKARSILFTDETIENWTHRDHEFLLDEYMRQMLWEVETRKAFGPEGFKRIERELAEDRQQMIEAGTFTGQAEKAYQEAQKELKILANRVRGKSNNTAPDWWKNVEETIKTVAFMGRLGGMLVSALPDITRPMKEFAGSAYGKAIKEFVSDPRVRDLSKKDARIAGTIIEVINNSRLHSIVNTDEGMVRPGAYRYRLRKWSNRFARLTGMPQMNDVYKQYTTLLSGHEMIEIALKRAQGINPRKVDVATYASLGLDEESLVRIAEQFNKHGKTYKGLYFPNFAEWDDMELMLDATGFINRRVNRIISTRTAGSQMKYADAPLWNLLFLFRGFTQFSHAQDTVAGLQRRDTRYLQGVVGSLFLGALAYQLKSIYRGRETPDDPDEWFYEAFEASGSAAVLTEIFNTVGAMDERLHPFYHISGGERSYRYGRRVMGGDSNTGRVQQIATAIAGPAVPVVADLGNLALSVPRAGIDLMAGEETDLFSSENIDRFYRNVPGHTLPYMALAFDSMKRMSYRAADEEVKGDALWEKYRDYTKGLFEMEGQQ